MKAENVFLLIIGWINLSLAQVTSSGSCNNNIETQPDFNAEMYLGRWYENQKYPFIFEAGGKCIFAEYSKMPNDKLEVYNYNYNTIFNSPSDIRGSAEVVGNAKLLVNFPGAPSFIGGANYWILETDYSNYAVVYSCTDILGILNAQVIWILTRERNPDPKYIAMAKNAITHRGLSVDSLQKTDQKNCK